MTIYQLEADVDDETGEVTWRVRKEDAPEMEILLSTSDQAEAVFLYAALVHEEIEAAMGQARIHAEGGPTILAFAPGRGLASNPTHRALMLFGRHASPQSLDKPEYA